MCVISCKKTNKINKQFLNKYVTCSDCVKRCWYLLIPASITFLLGETAAVRSRSCSSKTSLNSVMKSAKAFLSLDGPSLQLTYTHYNNIPTAVCRSTDLRCSYVQHLPFKFIRTCQHLGYSQSMSNPSKLYFLRNGITCTINRLLASLLFTKRLYLSPVESFHPPMANRTLMLRFFSATAFS